MARTARAAPGGWVYHVLNRSAGRIRLFSKEKDYEAFERVVVEAHARVPLRILSYCVMPNHWHFVVWPKGDGEVSEFFRWVGLTHAVRWRVSRDTVGWGHLYQGRFKSFPVQRDEHLLAVCRYVERNPLTAGLVGRAEAWRWGSLWARENGSAETKGVLSEWPVDRPAGWVGHVNAALTAKEVERVRVSMERDRPFGGEAWVRQTVARLGLGHTVRAEGRPRKEGERRSGN